MWDGWTGIEFLRILQDLRNSLPDFVTTFFEIISSAIFYLGVPLIIFMVIYWSGNKKDSEFGMLSCLTASMFAFVCKELIQQPRPWNIPGSGIDPSSEEFLAQYSYSLPSMHTAFATSGYGSIFIIVKKNWVKIVAVVLLVLIIFSRMFFCIHTPLDIIAGLAIAIVLMAVNWKLMQMSERDEKTYTKIAWGYIIVSVILATGILLSGKGAVTERTITVGFLVGITICRYIEHKYIGYRCPEISTNNKTILFIIGFVGLALFIGLPVLIFKLMGMMDVGLIIGGFLGPIWAMVIFTKFVMEKKSFLAKYCE